MATMRRYVRMRGVDAGLRDNAPLAGASGGASVEGPGNGPVGVIQRACKGMEGNPPIIFPAAYYDMTLCG